MSTYDAYPDNQHVALDASIYNYAFFIIFIFFNVFFFVVIPATIIFNSFRQKKSKLLLADDIRQKHSLILCFATLANKNLILSHKKLSKFLMFIYKKKAKYIDCISEICLKLDNYNSGHIVIFNYIFSKFVNLCNYAAYCKQTQS